MDRAGRHVFDADGKPELEPRYISVKELADCDSVEGIMALLGTHFISATLALSVCAFDFITN